jgi:selenocysteine lyase/cysteine desulfurase
VDAAHDAVAALMGAPPGSGHVALGPSSSQLLAALGGCYSRLLGPGDEVVVQESCHEANAGPWVRCAGAAAPRRGGPPLHEPHTDGEIID